MIFSPIYFQTFRFDSGHRRNGYKKINQKIDF
uniref:Uncharacterized protein n=1 Tax=Siphoviridae sp. ctzEO1 TaxID=2827979 RepID=A0A8S5TEC5_9CAUD|nr:MAG TPA: hypothetical protein [Siphoviridae sp. ctzEO1]DAP82422.1 MAG TPA: hypothetical protein [Caudoviricetes sp.]